MALAVEGRRGSDRCWRVLGNGAGTMDEKVIKSSLMSVCLLMIACLGHLHTQTGRYSHRRRNLDILDMLLVTSLCPLPFPLLLQDVPKTTTSQASTSISSTGTSSTSTKFPRSSLRIIFWFSTFVVPRSNL